ncbi:MAG: signal peptide protein [Clostridiales bacterium]|nr:signal peptide protein [Clostridiales bacterium]
MIVTLIKKDKIFSMTLPVKVNGQYWVADLDDRGKERKLISVEAINGEWVIRSNKFAKIIDSGNEVIKSTILKPLSFYNLGIKGENDKVLLFSEPITESRQKYKKLIVCEGCELSIGRANENSICFSNKFVSGNHAKLINFNNCWTITDTNSTNGTFVNGYRVSTKKVLPGDVIYIMGFKIIIGGSFIAINNPDERVVYDEKLLYKFVKQQVELIDEEEDDHIYQSNTEFFYRSPRFKRDVQTAEIKIDAPPAIQKLDQIPLALLLGPSITMGIMALSTGVLTLTNVMNGGGNMRSALPSLMMSVSMLLGTVLWPILTKSFEKKMRIKNEKKRQEKYSAYLESVRDDIVKECKLQSEILNENNVPLEECTARIKSQKRNLWERVCGQNDFLNLRLGIGNLPLDAEIKYPEKRFSMDDDNLQDALYSLADEPKHLVQVPVTYSLTEEYVSGLIGERGLTLDFVKGLILQLVSLHSYDEVKLVFLIDKIEVTKWEYIKWLPHSWDDTKSIRFLATDMNEVKELSAYIDREIINREALSDKEYKDFAPYYVVIAASKALADKAEMIVHLLKQKKNKGFSLITLFDELKNLPKECSMVIELDEKLSKIYDKDDISGKRIDFIADIDSCENALSLSTALANIQLDLSSQRYSLPNMLTFLEMFGVGKIEHLNPLMRWKENNPTITLQAPIGVDTMGGVFSLDLHEKFHGPHGLVAGMTGSGKSEFIITYILSLAVNYHPDEVAFILIDYKGGGLTGAFEDEDKGIKLPHLAGTITNLDGAAVKRSLISIQSELRRRQAVFNEARKISNEGTMDIYKYQKLYRDKVVSEAVPHLFIISDEFAELKSQQPEFMEQLISAARIGRSLGVHLILATQKPSGVVDDQIWSNSRFRVCLKVQEKADSMDMIKRPDAAELSATGRFYLQVGFNELFDLGQSAWCGAPYNPSDKVEKKLDDSIRIVDNLGRTIKEVKPAKKKSMSASNVKQIVAIVKYLSDLAVEENIKVRPLWLPAIPALIYVDALKYKYNYKSNRTYLNPIIGEYDDPFNQSQKLLTLPLSDDGNTIIYGATGNGKATILNAIIYSLIREHRADELNLYLLDFGAETLRAFSKAPHVGEVLFTNDIEKIINMFKMLQKEIDKRKKLFSDYGGDYKTYCKSAEKIVPNIVVIINNYSAFAELFECLENDLAQLTREGLKYGIIFILTASNTNAVRYRLQQNFKQLIVLQLNDMSDYTGVIGSTDGVYPSKIKGRGLIKNGRVYEFQTAHIIDGEDQYEYIRNICDELLRTSTCIAKKVPILPNNVNVEFVKSEIHGLDSVPVGVGKQSLQINTLNIRSKYISLVLSQEINQVEKFTQGLSEVISRIQGISTLVLDVEGLFSEDIMKTYEYIQTDFEIQIQELFKELVKRNNIYKDSKMDNKVLESFHTSVCIIVGLKLLYEVLTEDGKDKLKVMLDKGEALYNLHFIVCDSVSNIATFAYDAWYKHHISGGDGIWVGEGIADQYNLKLSKVSNDLYSEIGNGFGYVVNRGKQSLVKLLTSDSGGTEQ